MKYRRTVYETSGRDLAKVVTNFAKKKMPGRGFSCLMIGGTLQNGEKEVLELRFHTHFIPHIKKLLKELERLKEYEATSLEEMLTEVEVEVGKLDVKSEGTHYVSHPKPEDIDAVSLSEDEIDKVKGLIDQMDKAVHEEDDPAAARDAADRLRKEILDMTDKDDSATGASVREEPLCEDKYDDDDDDDDGIWPKELDDIADELINETDPDAGEEDGDGDDDIVDSTP